MNRKRKGLLVGTKCLLDDNIKMDGTEIGSEDMDWTRLALNRG
jgi:hypothetical protein